ncbi:MAG: TIR domain-containing protein [Leptolyngbya sp. LCM1.Bin17]|nr:MAG: TIR domain-containing protein [Leptolyngbya sp. LCM1.Bin17]
MTVAKAIFISYRRCDSIDIVGRIYDRLVAHFGANSVFKDVDSIPFGVNFRQHLEREVSHCPVLLAVIGPEWLTMADQQGHRRLDDPADWVRVEIEAALKRDSLVIPVLVGGASIPGDTDLPDSLRGLVYRQTALVRHDPDFHRDLDRLIQRLEEVFSRLTPPSGPPSSPYGALIDDLAAALTAAKSPPEPTARPLTRRRWLRLMGLGLLGGGSTLAVRPWRQSLQALTANRIATPMPSLATLPDRLQRAWTAATEVSSDRTDTYEFVSVTVDEFGRQRHQAQVTTQAYAEISLETPAGTVLLPLVAIAGGQFLQGAPATEPGHSAADLQPTMATVEPFWISIYPITQAQWRAVAQLPEVNRPLAANPAYFKGDDDRPVEQVSWMEAVEFCDRLSRLAKPGLSPFRLPTEAEWEYACRAKTTTPFHTGETLTTALANYDGTYLYRQEPVGTLRGTTTAVGSLGNANAFGLYDMHGNVLEWCADAWTQQVPEHMDGDTDTDSQADESPTTELIQADQPHTEPPVQVIRGGSWQSRPHHCRSAYRTGLIAHSRRRDVGFRIVRSQLLENQADSGPGTS